ncbi:vancomycin B-type resistance protein VanW [Rubritalea halochordaticola]|uniref:Vancomycin B-type resistance protein VanW n=1 Tax=Rubritalea halochordaticola TaxID=714537 RepID=A0ABP9V1J4_9BACT
MRRLLSHRHPLLYALAIRCHRAKRHLRWRLERSTYASDIETEHSLPCNVKRHSSRLIKLLGESEMQLQLNKVTNLKLCLPHLNGLLIRPGETFSFCKAVGKPTASRGFLEGMELSMGKAQSGIGGGICQMANMLHWLVLHSPLTITERSTHSFDPFPDQNRSIPFGTGCAIFYNYIDFAFRNDTNLTFQLLLDIDEKNLNGQLVSDAPTEHTYKVFEKNHHFLKQGPTFYRHNEIWRKVLSRYSGDILHEEHLKTNHVRVMYTPETWVDID